MRTGGVGTTAGEGRGRESRRDRRGTDIAKGDESTISSSIAEDDTILPFHVDVPQEALADLRRRIEATRWPDAETVGDEGEADPHAGRLIRSPGSAPTRTAESCKKSAHMSQATVLEVGGAT
jgi:hypothetical protein